MHIATLPSLGTSVFFAKKCFLKEYREQHWDAVESEIKGANSEMSINRVTECQNIYQWGEI